LLFPITSWGLRAYERRRWWIRLTGNFYNWCDDDGAGQMTAIKNNAVTTAGRGYHVLLQTEHSTRLCDCGFDCWWDVK
jgi:hypothetical protein